DLIYAPAFGSTKKNATDIRLAVDATELVFTRPEIGTFILLSGDSDFSSLVLKLKEYGKYVIGVGMRESASDLLIQNCDEYYSYSDLAGLTREADLPTVARDPWELTREAVEQMARNGDVMRSDRLKQVMQQLDPNFDERDVGFNRFSKFVLEAAQKGLLAANKLENGQYEVAPVAAPAPAARSERPAEEGRRGRRGRGRGRERGERKQEPAAAAPAAPQREGGLTLARAFNLMSDALAELGGPVQQDALRARMAAMVGRNDPLLEEARFVKLLRQANDAEIADVRKLDDGTYEVSRTNGAVRPAPRAEANRAAVPSTSSAVPAAPAAEPAEAEAVAAASREPARGLRFRRGSRSPVRPGEVPLVGVVKIEPMPSAAEPASAEAAPSEEAATPAKRSKSTRKRATKRSTARKAAATAAPKAEEAPPAPEKPAKKTTRSRARKKAKAAQ
ncbi:MAG TPA: NYN domain-containing protein, partial [Gemmatimonadales bacterium]|nr:NYN domain-containing protein [Gemmatimonadales bacterium]